MGRYDGRKGRFERLIARVHSRECEQNSGSNPIKASCRSRIHPKSSLWCCHRPHAAYGSSVDPSAFEVRICQTDPNTAGEQEQEESDHGCNGPKDHLHGRSVRIQLNKGEERCSEVGQQKETACRRGHLETQGVERDHDDTERDPLTTEKGLDHQMLHEIISVVAHEEPCEKGDHRDQAQFHECIVLAHDPIHHFHRLLHFSVHGTVVRRHETEEEAVNGCHDQHEGHWFEVRFALSIEVLAQGMAGPGEQLFKREEDTTVQYEHAGHGLMPEPRPVDPVGIGTLATSCAERGSKVRIAVLTPGHLAKIGVDHHATADQAQA